MPRVPAAQHFTHGEMMWVKKWQIVQGAIPFGGVNVLHVLDVLPLMPLALFDMAGNVFEWTEDCWNNTFEGVGLDGAAYQNPAGCGKRVIRGGGWSFPPKEIRSANRWRDFPTRKSDDTGFRVLRELD